jgi:large subunit ribosomal protein L25
LGAALFFPVALPESFVMAETVVLKTQPRDLFGSANARRLRQKGLLPAVLYGHQEEHLSVVLSAEEFDKAFRHGVRVLELDTGKKRETARIRELQWDHLGKDVLHVDFMRVSKDERIVVNVRVELRGIAPGVGPGGVLDQPLHTLSIECLALEIPDHIRVSIDGLQVGDAVHVKDVKMPPGVVAKDDPDAIVVHVKAVKEEVAAPAAVAPVEGATAEPEVIKKPPKEEEAEE